MRLVRLPFFALLLAICFGTTGCDAFKEEPKVEVAERLPPKVCDEVSKTLLKLESEAVLTLNTPTDGVMERTAWIALRPGEKTALLTSIGLAATCASAPRLEQEVTLHSPDGELLARRVVKTSYSLDDALGA